MSMQPQSSPKQFGAGLDTADFAPTTTAAPSPNPNPTRNLAISRLPTSANVSTTTFLPRPVLAGHGRSNFGLGFVGMQGVGGGGQSSTGILAGTSLAAAGVGLDSILIAAYGSSGCGGRDGPAVSVRALLSPQQQQRFSAFLAASDESGDMDPSALVVDPAPLVGSLSLGSRAGSRISGLEALSDRLLVATTEGGSMEMIEIQSTTQEITRTSRRMTRGMDVDGSVQLRSVHSFSSLSLHLPDTSPHSSSPLSLSIPLTSLSVHSHSSTPLIATASDAGCWSLVAPLTRQVLRRVPGAHPGSINCIRFGFGFGGGSGDASAGAGEGSTSDGGMGSVVHTAGMGGKICTWDIRAPFSSASNDVAGIGAGSTQSKPTSFMTDPNAVSITSLSLHPSRANLLVSGSSNGALALFDTRGGTTSRSGSLLSPSSSNTPLCSIQAHRGSILATSFIPWRPMSLLTSGIDGALCCFDFGGGGGGHGAGGGGQDTLGGWASIAPQLIQQQIQATDAPFLSEEVQKNMKPSKLYQHAFGLNSFSLDRDTRTILCGADGQSLVMMQE